MSGVIKRDTSIPYVSRGIIPDDPVDYKYKHFSLFYFTNDSCDLDLTRILKVNKWRKKQHCDKIMLDKSFKRWI